MDGRFLLRENGIHWTCLKDKCEKNCCGAEFEMRQTSNRLCSVFKLHHNQVPLLPNEKELIAEKYGSHYIRQDIDGGFYINLSEDGKCPFLTDKGLCKIQEIKPTLCRAYPFYIDIFSGLNVDADCPGFGKGFTDRETVNKMLEALIEVYELQIKKVRKIASWPANSEGRLFRRD
ncbi:MAG: YkgJ family cysteine cluster protein [Candidatus Hydrogenedentota bacterium]|nr:MAG: YkgJ family cysteine cluster protein [Candidatus Hydrogenedentota bacterium]